MDAIQLKTETDVVKTEGPNRYSRDEVTIASGSGEVEIGEVLGKVTATGKYKPLAPAASDGTQTAARISLQSADATGMALRTAGLMPAQSSSGWMKSSPSALRTGRWKPVRPSSLMKRWRCRWAPPSSSGSSRRRTRSPTRTRRRIRPTRSSSPRPSAITARATTSTRSLTSCRRTCVRRPSNA